MTFWIVLWKLTLIAAVLAFMGMSVWVTIGGAQDIKRLLEQLRRDTQDDETSDQPKS